MQEVHEFQTVESLTTSDGTRRQLLFPIQLDYNGSSYSLIGLLNNLADTDEQVNLDRLTARFLSKSECSSHPTVFPRAAIVVSYTSLGQLQQVNPVPVSELIANALGGEEFSFISLKTNVKRRWIEYNSVASKYYECVEFSVDYKVPKKYKQLFRDQEDVHASPYVYLAVVLERPWAFINADGVYVHGIGELHIRTEKSKKLFLAGRP